MRLSWSGDRAVDDGERFLKKLLRSFAVLRDITARLRDATFDAMSNDFHLEDRASRVTKANQKARERIDQAWPTLEGRVSIVSGKRVLSMLSDWAKRSHSVSFGPARIAQELTHYEIDPEVRAVVSAIENNFHSVSEGLQESSSNRGSMR
jgi:hypothetical protein